MTTPLTPAEIAALQLELTTVKQQLADEVLKSKSVEYYSAAINAWFNTSLEFDKSMFALSGGWHCFIGILTVRRNKLITPSTFYCRNNLLHSDDRVIVSCISEKQAVCNEACTRLTC